jgi:hypothetical protein
MSNNDDFIFYVTLEAAIFALPHVFIYDLISRRV